MNKAYVEYAADERCFREAAQHVTHALQLVVGQQSTAIHWITEHLQCALGSLEFQASFCLEQMNKMKIDNVEEYPSAHPLLAEAAEWILIAANLPSTIRLPTPERDRGVELAELLLREAEPRPPCPGAPMCYCRKDPCVCP